MPIGAAAWPSRERARFEAKKWLRSPEGLLTWRAMCRLGLTLAALILRIWVCPGYTPWVLFCQTSNQTILKSVKWMEIRSVIQVLHEYMQFDLVVITRNLFTTASFFAWAYWYLVVGPVVTDQI